MDLNAFHFAHPLWLWALLAIPLIGCLYFLYTLRQQPEHQLEKFIDKHLLPYLLIETAQKKKRGWTQLIFWSLVWSCLTWALAGPRWNYHEVATFTRDQSLAILLDLSESMNADDIAPSRLGRAKQKIEDLLNMSKGVNIGLIAFAADPHMIVPMTDDKETIRHLLPSLDTDLVYVQGSKLSPALEMAATMLKNEPGNNKAIVVISDGGFEDASALHTAKKIAEKGIVIHTLGVGTLEGAPLKNRQGALFKKNGSSIISKLEKDRFRAISNIGHGRYFEANHSQEVALIFEDLEKRSEIQQEADKTQGFWEEHFYLFLLPILPFFLWWYQRGYIFALLFFIFIPSYSQASLNSYFYNTEQRGQQSFEDDDYTTAAQQFQDPYRKGVAYYRLKDYPAAEEMFRQSSRPEVACHAGYNLGNALAYQNKLQEAITAYEEVLETYPDHTPTKENLEIVKKMLEQQKQEQQKDNKNQQQQGNEGNSDNQDNKDSSEEQSQDSASNDKDSDNAESKENPDKGENSDPPPEEKDNKEEQPQQQPTPPENERNAGTPRSQEDLDADLWLDQIKNDPKSFLKNKFYLESKKTATKGEVDPW